jgi:hypothetical protein
MVLAQNRCINQWTITKDQKQTHKLHPSDGWQRWQKHSSERKKKTASWANVGETEYPHVQD